MRKRLTSILLTLAMLVGLLPALSPQAEAAASGAIAREHVRKMLARLENDESEASIEQNEETLD